MDKENDVKYILVDLQASISSPASAYLGVGDAGYICKADRTLEAKTRLKGCQRGGDLPRFDALGRQPITKIQLLESPPVTTSKESHANIYPFQVSVYALLSHSGTISKQIDLCFRPKNLRHRKQSALA